MSVSVQLSKPIKVGEIETSVVDLREPTPKDVRELGFPFVVVQAKSGSGTELLPDVAIKYAARLSNNPPSAFNDISINDLVNLQVAVMGFFGGEA